MIPIIDTHQHLWDLDRFKLTWMTPGEAPLGRSYRTADYAEATARLGVVKSIYMEVDVAPDEQVAEAEYVLGLIREARTPMVAAVISGRPSSDGFAAYLDRFRAEPAIKGVRQVLHVPSTPAGYCLDPAFVRGIRELGKRGLSFDLCMRSPELGDAARLIDACPDTRFILDHCGNESVLSKDHAPWKRLVDQIASKGDRVVCKVSGIVASAKGHPWSEDDLAPVVNHVLDAFGPSRVMFGGDWPVCTLAATYRRWVEALRAMVKDRPEDQRRKLFHDNAARFYGLA
jgi:L-fuconolactonase